MGGWDKHPDYGGPRPTRLGTLALVLVIAAIIVGVTTCSLRADPIMGKANAVIDGDGLVVDGVEIRLCGIDAPEFQRPGGREATDYLRRLVAGREVICIRVGEGSVCDGRSRPRSYDRVVAQCFIGQTDLAGQMVRAGHAVDWPRFSGGAYR
ncbi:thermonuclease family protein [Notoacmeibacter ruber]|uniref:Thermonuclease family protein n=1 Tax=Notoacmeibacter ruber TaxID=2670375 RepID=A0A3L7JDT9_9HYPH|nr:thermonuclease family protein [Notoacmeibacter ruber]RLQ88937.1 thermonuclease family protein [Notoacmeibacter ruber]